MDHQYTRKLINCVDGNSPQCMVIHAMDHILDNQPDKGEKKVGEIAGRYGDFTGQLTVEGYTIAEILGGMIVSLNAFAMLATIDANFLAESLEALKHAIPESKKPFSTN